MSKFYAIRKGNKPGIYTNWNEAQRQINGFSGSEFKSFETLEEAEEYLNAESMILPKLGNDYSDKEILEIAKRYPITVFTDGGSIGNHNQNKNEPAAWSYFIAETGKKFSSAPDAPAGSQRGASNNVMEITALLNAIEELSNTGYSKKPILFGIDSQYVINGVINLDDYREKGWKNSSGEVKNLELWKKVYEKIQDIPNYKFVKIHSHANVNKNFFTRGNDKVDRSLGKLNDLG